jgi:hypothetical protein
LLGDEQTSKHWGGGRYYANSSSRRDKNMNKIRGQNKKDPKYLTCQKEKKREKRKKTRKRKKRE